MRHEAAHNYTHPFAWQRARDDSFFYYNFNSTLWEEIEDADAALLANLTPEQHQQHQTQTVVPSEEMKERARNRIVRVLNESSETLSRLNEHYRNPTTQMMMEEI